jgi:hypothetical protein
MLFVSKLAEIPFRREVLNIHIRRDCLETESSDGDAGFSIDIDKVKPVARLGYGQEYTVISEMLERK